MFILSDKTAMKRCCFQRFIAVVFHHLSSAFNTLPYGALVAVVFNTLPYGALVAVVLVVGVVACCPKLASTFAEVETTGVCA